MKRVTPKLRVRSKNRPIAVSYYYTQKATNRALGASLAGVIPITEKKMVDVEKAIHRDTVKIDQKLNSQKVRDE